MSENENTDLCGICGEAHQYSKCECVPLTKHIPDRVFPPKARASLPEDFSIETMADGTYGVCANTFIEKGTKLGPLQAGKLLTLEPVITFPLKLFVTSEEDFLDYYLNTADEHNCNWIMFIPPAQYLEEQNVICFQHKSEIIYMCLKDVHPGDYLRVWYSDYYGKKMKKEPLLPCSLPMLHVDVTLEPVDMNKLLKKQQKLVDRENWTCKFCGKLENDIPRFSHHIIEHYSKRKLKIKCEECDQTYSTKKSLRVHMKKIHNKSIVKKKKDSSNADNMKPKESIVGGPLLNSLLADSLDNTNLMLSNIELNLNVLENDTLSLAVDNLLTDNVKGLDHFNFEIAETQEQFVCDICLKMFTKLQNLIQHLRKHTGRFTCSYCLKIFCRKENLIMHNCGRDTNTKHTCTICGKTFSSERYLRRHTNVVHNAVYACDKCKKRHSTLKDYKNHNCTALSNNVEQVFPCSTCGKKFVRYRYLQRHALRHKQKEIKQLNQKFICEVCGADQTTRAGLLLHKKTHEERLFECSLCKKTFHKKDCLRAHELTHADQQKVTCNICNKELRNENTLKIHMRLHRTSNPHKCDKCPCSFVQAASLRAHNFKVHLNGCNVCNKEFQTPDLLAMHRKAHILKEFYVCPICSRPMKLKTSLLRHAKKSHPEADHVALMNNLKAVPANLVVVQPDEQSDKENAVEEQPTLSQLVSTQESDDSNFDSIVDNFENIINSYNVNTNENLSLSAYTDPKTNDDRGILDFTDLQMDIESSFDVGAISINNQDICLSMPDLTEADQEIMLGDNAFIMENGTIVERKDQGNVLVYVLDENL